MESFQTSITEFYCVPLSNKLNTLPIAHEGSQVKKSKIDMLNRQYELFRMKDRETIQEIHIKFTYIVNEIYSLGEIFSNRKAVRKLLCVLLESKEKSKSSQKLVTWIHLQTTTTTTTYLVKSHKVGSGKDRVYANHTSTS